MFEWLKEEYRLTSEEVNLAIEEKLETEEVELSLKKRKRGNLDLIYGKEMIHNLLKCGKEWHIMKLIESYSSSHNLPAALSVCNLVLQKTEDQGLIKKLKRIQKGLGLLHINI